MAKKEKTDLEIFQKWLNEFMYETGKTSDGWVEPKNHDFSYPVTDYAIKKKPKRARTKKGRYKGDDKSTPNVNEAWVGGKSPKKRKK